MSQSRLKRESGKVKSAEKSLLLRPEQLQIDVINGGSALVLQDTAAEKMDIHNKKRGSWILVHPAPESHGR